VSEAERLHRQIALDHLKSAAERNRLGQFATPPVLAHRIAREALCWHGGGPVRFGEPALGTGAFYSALRDEAVPGQIERAVGFELDPAFAEAARTLWKESGLTVIRGDFTEKGVRESVGIRPNLILANPPYVRHHHLHALTKTRLKAEACRIVGIEPSGLSGLYVYFLLLAHEWMVEGGIAAWLIPTEFMEVNYGAALRRYLTERVQLLRVHRFRSEDAQFVDALVSSCVVIFRKVTPDAGAMTRFTMGGSMTNPDAGEEVSLARLSGSVKWTRFPQKAVEASISDSLTLAELFTIRRGLATGANGFFLMEREEARRLELPEAFLKPILPGPRYVNQQIVESEGDGFPALSPQRVLLDCRLPEQEVRERYPALWRYLESGREAGLTEGYLLQRRSPWWLQEQREPAPFLCTYMGRSAEGRSPFRFLLNRSAAVVHNVYLMLYPKPTLQQWLAEAPGRDTELLERLNGLDKDTLMQEGRSYGGGLNKIEPKELGRLKLERRFFNVQALLWNACL
jgi:adenine-specific DNA-methyltransferase